MTDFGRGSWNRKKQGGRQDGWLLMPRLIKVPSDSRGLLLVTVNTASNCNCNVAARWSCNRIHSNLEVVIT